MKRNEDNGRWHEGQGMVRGERNRGVEEAAMSLQCPLPGRKISDKEWVQSERGHVPWWSTNANST